MKIRLIEFKTNGRIQISRPKVEISETRHDTTQLMTPESGDTAQAPLLASRPGRSYCEHCARPLSQTAAFMGIG